MTMQLHTFREPGKLPLPCRPPSREDIAELEAAMLAAAADRDAEFIPGNTDHIAPVKHHFAPGLYAREIFLPAGTRIVGKIHRTAHLMTVVAGRGLLWNEFAAYEYRAPFTHVTVPLVKNVLWVIDDSIIVTYHPTDLTDVDAIEREIILDTYDQLPAAAAKEMIK